MFLGYHLLLKCLLLFELLFSFTLTPLDAAQLSLVAKAAKIVMDSMAGRWARRTALVTGGNSGVGAAIVRRLTCIGVNVVSLDRRIDNLEILSNELSKQKGKGKLYAIKGNLRKEEDIKSAFDWIEKNLGVVHVLVNNAGCISADTLLDGDTEQWRQVLEVNILAPAVCTREAVKSMQAHGFDEGHIININSILGHNVLTFASPMYTASKHAVTALSDALRKQLSAIRSKIRVTSISPGFVQTELLQSVPIMRKAAEGAAIMPSDVASAVVYALSVPQEVQMAEMTVVPQVEFDGRIIDEATLEK